MFNSYLVDRFLDVTVKNVCEDNAQINPNKAPSNASFMCTEDLSVNLESRQTINHSCTYGEKYVSEACQRIIP